MRYDSLIWDFDGTLLDTYPPMSRDLQRVMAALGVSLPLEEIQARFQCSRGEVLEYCAARSGLTAAAVDRAYRDYVSEKGHPAAEPFPHVEETLSRFQAAGGRNFIFTHRSGSVHEYLERAGLSRYFADVVSSGQAFARKPDPAGNCYLMSKHGLDPVRTLAVGDRELDVLAGKRAGADACLFRGSGAATAADYRITDMAELAGIIGLAK